MRCSSTTLVRVSVALAFFASGCPDASQPQQQGSADTISASAVDDAGADAADSPPPPPPPAECETTSDCDLKWASVIPACKAASCVDGSCELVDAADGTSCELDDPCVEAAQCIAGQCEVASGLSCDDGNACTTDNCDPASGCVYTFNQRPCDDGTSCTTGDRCFQGACTGDLLSCNDNNPCTDDVCDPNAGCVNTENTDICTDGDACTDGDTCKDGACIAGPPLDCDDGEVCTTEYCDTADGCIVAILDGPCDDGDACTDNTTCIAGVCTGTPVNCNDNNACTTDSCDISAGCVYFDNKNPCEDGESCTLNDMCDAGVCVPGNPDPLCCLVDGECDDGDPCTDDSCEAEYCAFVPKDCDDGFPCTEDSCSGGNCDHQPVGPQLTGTIVTDGFEKGSLGEWKVKSDNVDVTWQLDTSDSHTGEASIYCGNPESYSYDFGKTLATLGRSISMPLANQLTLRFWAFVDVAEASCSYDKVSVYVGGTLLTPELCDDTTVWTEQVYDISAFAGQTVLVEFRFDTVDTVANNGPGVWIDDFEVVAEGPADCCLKDADCDAGSGTGCQAVGCDTEAYSCQPGGAAACDDQDPCTSDSCQPDGSCSNDTIEGCCQESAECPTDPAKPCAVATCDGGQCGLDVSACCVEDAECPTSRACEVATCEADGSCSVDDSACCATNDDCNTADCQTATCLPDGTCDIDSSQCCTDPQECPGDPSKPCAVATCEAGTCGLDESACCATNMDCPDNTTAACEQNICLANGSCDVDASLCCTVAGDCPEAPEGPCAVASCIGQGVCSYNTSACP